MLLRPFPRDRRCPHCGARSSLYLEELMGGTDIVCVLCGYRRIDALPRRSPAPAGRQQPLPVGLHSDEDVRRQSSSLES